MLLIAESKKPKSGWGRKLIRWLGGIAFLALASVGVWFWLSHRQPNEEGASSRFNSRMTTTVGVAVAKKGDIRIFLQGLGTVTPPATVMVKPQVSGQLVQIAFTEGQHIKKGDDAIVVIENISRYIEMGESPLEAALKGSKQIGFTIVSLTISLIAVHFPLLFMGDVIGRLFHEFSVTSVVTIVLSAVVSLTLVPMLCAKMLRHQQKEKASRFERLSRGTVDGMIRQYGRLLSWVLRHQGWTLIVATGTLVLTIWLYIIIPKGFFPVQDTGLVQGVTQAPQSTSYDAMVKRQAELAKRILKDADVVNLSSFVGVDGSNTTLNSGRFLIGLKPHDDRKLSSQEIVRRLERESQGVEGINLFLQPVQDLTTDAAVIATQYKFVLENADLNELNTWVPKLVSRLQNVQEITDLASDLEQSGLSANRMCGPLSLLQTQTVRKARSKKGIAIFRSTPTIKQRMQTITGDWSSPIATIERLF